MVNFVSVAKAKTFPTSPMTKPPGSALDEAVENTPDSLAEQFLKNIVRELRKIRIYLTAAYTGLHLIIKRCSAAIQ